MSSGSPVDLVKINQLKSLGTDSGDPDFFNDIGQTYLKDAVVKLASMRKSFREGDLRSVYLLAHTFKSSSANLGATQVALHCAAIEEMTDAASMPDGKPTPDRLTSIENELKALVQAYALAASMLEKIFNEKSP